MVAALAVVGLSASLFILFSPDAGATLSDRASVSSAVAALFALFAAIVAVSAGVWVTSSDYRAAEAVKRDYARVRSTLRSTMLKASLPEKPGVDPFEAERDVLNGFLCSTSAFGYWAWAEQGKTDQVGVAGERRSSIFLTVVSLVDACQPPWNQAAVYHNALRLEDLLMKSDVDNVSSALANGILGLAGRTGGKIATAETSNDILLRSISEVFGDEPEARRDNETRSKFQYLKRKGVGDPNVDLFVAVFESDTEALQAALDAGADTTVTDTQVLADHEADLADFDPTHDVKAARDALWGG